MVVQFDWREPRPDSFCEGFLWKQLVPGFDEFFNGLSGFFILLIGFVGLFQPRLEVLTKMMYSGVIVSGVGTIMLHWRRIEGFNLADTIPLLITLTFGIIAFFDEIIFEFRRPRAAGGNLLAVRDFDRERRNERVRMALTSIFYTLAIFYLAAGVLLLIYSEIEYIFGIYFGVPYGFFAIFGMAFITYRHRQDRLPNSGPLARLALISVISALVSVGFKIIDSTLCSPTTIWLFPHALFHIILTYSTHGVITFLTFYRANNFVMLGEGHPRVDWRLGFFPMVSIPFLVPVERRAPPIHDLMELKPPAENPYRPSADPYLQHDDDDDDDHLPLNPYHPAQQPQMMMQMMPPQFGYSSHPYSARRQAASQYEDF